jgi:hypothetical protein
MLQKFIDLKVLYRTHNRLGFPGRYITQDTPVGPLSLWERAGVRGFSATNKKRACISRPVLLV